MAHIGLVYDAKLKRSGPAMRLTGRDEAGNVISVTVHQVDLKDGNLVATKVHYKRGGGTIGEPDTYTLVAHVGHSRPKWMG